MSTESNTPVDPRVQVELEKLNSATDNINRYEVELDEAKCEFKRLLAESVVRIKGAAHKLGNSIDAAKPYSESRIYAAQLAKGNPIGRRQPREGQVHSCRRQGDGLPGRAGAGREVNAGHRLPGDAQPRRQQGQSVPAGGHRHPQRPQDVPAEARGGQQPGRQAPGSAEASAPGIQVKFMCSRQGKLLKNQ
ncbi:GD15836 [Drosophila simulans]|uniref:GD15836 n=1 Tax=Drosophila simulans TaxID=7240 RepID=B4R4V9_DROSI|nr:GD15836 [Drosophila simulans]